MNGLAAQGMQQPQEGMPQGNDEQMMALVQEVIKLLQQGITPEELMAKGVPQEIIKMAIDILNQQTQPPASTGVQPQPMVEQPAQGLATQGLR